MMPRMLVLVVLLASCRFDADYGGGHYTCTDEVCPAGLICNLASQCVEPTAPDAAVDGLEAPPDALPYALTCADPGPITRGVEHTFTGTTVGGTDRIDGSCASRVLVGPDDVFEATALAGDRLDLTIDGDAVVRAYVILACVMNQPACQGNMLASPGTPLAVTGLPAGSVWVVVDSENAALGGDYTLTVTVGP
jgi:hypothetical protein